MRLLSALAFAFAATWTPVTSARIAETTAYTKEQTMNAAFRFLRVDSSYTIVERDLELGYVLFEYPTGNGQQTTTGSVEVIERDEEVLLIVQIPKLPSYHESVLVRGLVSKLRADYGEPPKPRKSKPDSEPKEPPPAEEDDKDPKDPDAPPSDGAVPRYRIK